MVLYCDRESALKPRGPKCAGSPHVMIFLANSSFWSSGISCFDFFLAVEIVYHHFLLVSGSMSSGR